MNSDLITREIIKFILDFMGHESIAYFFSFRSHHPSIDVTCQTYVMYFRPRKLISEEKITQEIGKRLFEQTEAID